MLHELSRSMGTYRKNEVRVGQGKRLEGWCRGGREAEGRKTS